MKPQSWSYNPPPLGRHPNDLHNKNTVKNLLFAQSNPKSGLPSAGTFPSCIVFLYLKYRSSPCLSFFHLPPHPFYQFLLPKNQDEYQEVF